MPMVHFMKPSGCGSEKTMAQTLNCVDKKSFFNAAGGGVNLETELHIEG